MSPDGVDPPDEIKWDAAASIVWSPCGTMLGVPSTRNVDLVPSGSVQVVDAASGTVRNHWTGAGYGENAINAAWNHSGTKLVFDVETPDGTKLRIADISTGAVSPAFAYARDTICFEGLLVEWSPSGTKIACPGDRGYCLRIVNAGSRVVEKKVLFKEPLPPQAPLEAYGASSRVLHIEWSG